MKNNAGIPSHDYIDTLDTIQQVYKKPRSSFDPQLPFAMTKFELMNEHAQANYSHRHNCYEVLYICEGEGTHIIDFEPYAIKPPMFFFLSKDQVHFWQLTKPLKGYALLFPEEFLGFPSSKVIGSHDFAFFHNVGQAPFLSVEQESLTMINGLVEGIEKEFHNEADRSLSVLRAYLHILFTQLHRLYSADHMSGYSSAASSLVRQFEQLVSEHYIEEHSVQDYAKKIGVSSSHLKDTVKAVTGYAPGQIIRQKLILEAKRLLAHSNITAAEIGYRLNFEDASYFGRFFKRETGMSPTAFRQQVRDQYKIT